MSQHLATIHWRRGHAAFVDKRYSRAHVWRFDGGAEVLASYLHKVSCTRRTAMGRLSLFVTQTLLKTVIRRPGSSATEREIIDWMRERLAHYKCPKSIDFVDALPRNPSGKLLKRLLRAPYWEGKARGVN